MAFSPEASLPLTNDRIIRKARKNGLHIVLIACIDIRFDDSGQCDRHDSSPSPALVSVYVQLSKARSSLLTRRYLALEARILPIIPTSLGPLSPPERDVGDSIPCIVDADE